MDPQNCILKMTNRDEFFLTSSSRSVTINANNPNATMRKKQFDFLTTESRRQV